MMVTLEFVGLGMASLLALVGTMFMLMCRKVWLDFFETSAFKNVDALVSEEVFPLVGALTSNFLFIAGVCIFSLGMVSVSLLIGAASALVALAGVLPFATMFVIMKITKQTPIGIPVEHLSAPPLPAALVISGSAVVLSLSVASDVRAGVLDLSVLQIGVLVFAAVIPNLVALRHRQAGWLHQPRPHNS